MAFSEEEPNPNYIKLMTKNQVGRNYTSTSLFIMEGVRAGTQAGQEPGGRR